MVRVKERGQEPLTRSVGSASVSVRGERERERERGLVTRSAVPATELGQSRVVYVKRSIVAPSELRP